MKKIVNERYDLSKEVAFNGEPCSENEVLVPVILSEDMRKTLMTAGFKQEYAKTWRFPGTSQKVPVAFVPWPKESKEEGIKEFNRQVSDYLKRFKRDTNLVSLDEIFDNINDEDKKSKDPTGTRKFDSSLEYEILLADVISELNKINSKMAMCIDMLTQGYKKCEILECLELGVAKTQGYEFIKNDQKLAKKMIDGDL